MYRLRSKRKACIDLPDLHINKRLKQSNSDSAIISSRRFNCDSTSSIPGGKKNNSILKQRRYIDKLPIPAFSSRDKEYYDLDSDNEALSDEISQINHEIDDLQTRIKKQSETIKSLFTIKDQIEREQKDAIQEYSTEEALESKLTNDSIDESDTRFHTSSLPPILFTLPENQTDSSTYTAWDAISQDLMILSQEYELNVRSQYTLQHFLMNSHQPYGSI